MAVRRRSTGEYELSRKQLLKIVDERARRYLGMSGSEFTKRLAAGELPHSSIVEHLASLTGDRVR